MKDYYHILGVPDNASQDDIKRAFRRLAFQYHPDTNPDHKQESEEKFKRINEAYGVLGNQEKRRQYDFARKGQFAGYGAGYQGFQYSQQDIFRDIFSNPAMFDELSRMFAQAGLRFDRDFLNRVFFAGQGFIFQFFTTPGAASQRAYQQPYSQAGVPAHKPGLIERLLSKIALKVSRYMLKKLLGLEYETSPEQGLDQHIELEVSPDEANTGGEKDITHKQGNKTRRLVVKVPPGVKTGAKIRLKGMGTVKDKKHGDLYLHVRVKNK